MRNTEPTRPSIACGVMLWRSVVVLMVHTMGPAPKRKKLAAASTPVGHASVATIVKIASTETAGPSWIARPKGSAATMREASSAPVTMPTP